MAVKALREIVASVNKDRRRFFLSAVKLLEELPEPEKFAWAFKRVAEEMANGNVKVRSSLEVAVATILAWRDEDAYHEHRIITWVNGVETTIRVDFYLPRYELIIEVDGSWFHGTPERRAEDLRRSRTLVLQGYTVVRLTESKIRLDLLAAVGMAIRAGRRRRSYFRDAHHFDQEREWVAAKVLTQNPYLADRGHYVMPWDNDWIGSIGR